MPDIVGDIDIEGRRILAVDDEPLNLELLEAILVPEGYRMDRADGGPSALDQVRQAPPDLILLDVMMPVMNGYELCAAIRADAGIPYIPIVFLTAAHTGVDHLVKGLGIGGDDYVCKPFDHFELLSRIRAALRIKVLYDSLVRTKQELSRYVSLSTLRMLERRNLGTPAASGQISEVAVLFSDIRGFTHIAEDRDPAAVFHMLNTLLGRQMQVIRDHGGIIDKLSGDEIMAIFEGPDMAPDALRTACAIRRVLREDPACDWEDETGVGIGIACGPVYVGSLGSEVFKDFTVIGNTVNIAARLCGVAKKFQILFTEATRALAASSGLRHRPIGRARLKGISRPMPVYELLD